LESLNQNCKIDCPRSIGTSRDSRSRHRQNGSLFQKKKKTVVIMSNGERTRHRAGLVFLPANPTQHVQIWGWSRASWPHTEQSVTRNLKVETAMTLASCGDMAQNPANPTQVDQPPALSSPFPRDNPIFCRVQTPPDNPNTPCIS
jgi:hypothetical protein